MLTIYTNETNPAALKLLIASNCAQKQINLIIADVNDRLLPPPGHLPYLQLDTTVIFIPNAAIWSLLPSNGENSKINEWLEWEARELTPNLAHLFGTNVRNDILKQNVIKCLEKLEKSLENRTYIIGTSMTVADIAIWSITYPLIKDTNLSKEFLSNHTNLVRWFKNCEEKPEVQTALSSFKINSGVISYQALFIGGKYLLPSPVENQQQQQHQSESPINKVETITDDELQSAQKSWEMDILKHPKLRPRKQVGCPIAGEKNIFITSALPYVNNVPHLGNIIGCVLSADVFARYCRLCNYNTLYIAGTDEYGTATETKALEEGLSCKAICDKYFAIHDDIYKWFNIDFDYFGRTSTPQQTEICQELFLQLNNNGFMFTDIVEQLYCEKCDRYLADRFVEGGCPNIGCTYEDARGDQCDGCGKLVNAVELKNPRCKICRSTPKLKQSAQFFFDLPKLEPLLLHWIKKSSPGWSNNAKVIAQSWLKEGLKPRCITRDLKWGVPVPLNDYKNKVFYVWFDAPIGYMSITKAYTGEHWKEWWQPKQDVNVTLYQFMAKDNVPFHSVMFPATLLGCNRGYTTVSHIMATEYLNYEDGKFSKSRGVGVFGNDARDTGIPSDVWRFYLLYVRPESQDSSFSWADLATKNNSELLNNLGNFVNRALMFAKNNFNKSVPEMQLIKDDFLFLALCNRELKSYMNCLEKCKLRDGIRHILAISRHGNQYLQANQPWVLLKGSPEDKIRAGTIIGICCNIACLLSMLLNPYMPETSENLKKQLNAQNTALIPEIGEVCQLLPAGHKLGEMSPLFAKLEPAKLEELKQRFAGQQQQQQSEQKQQINTNKNVKLLESEVAKQADKVRAMKSSGVDKKLWQPEVEILLKLKKDLEYAQKNSTSNVNHVVAAPNSDEVKNLEDEVAKQGLVVRKLKEGGANKAEWQPEVNKLLELKSKLANLLGLSAEDSSKKGKKSKK